MKRLIALLAAAALVAAPLEPVRAYLLQKSGTVVTATSQLLMMNTLASMSTTSVRYYPVGYSFSAVAASTSFTLIPVAGAISTMKFAALTAPTSTQTWAVTLMKNDVATAQTCTVTSSSSPAGTCASSTSVSFAAGDWASWKIQPTNSPNASFGSMVFEFTPTNPNDTIIVGLGSGFSTSAVTASHPQADASAVSAASRRQSILADDGTVDKLFVISTAPGAAASGKSYDFSVGKNGSATAVTTQILETATSNSDLTHSASFAGGEDIQFQGSPTGTPTAATASFGVRYVPTCTGGSGCFPIMAIGANSTDSLSVKTFYPVSGGASAGGAGFTEAQVNNISRAQTITKLAVKLFAAPGLAASGKKRRFMLRVNQVDAGLTCDVVETATTCSATGSVAVSDGDLLSTSDDPTIGTASPSTGSPAITYSAHR